MIREFAPAKVNLFLHVVGRRPDGYHLLESMVVFADVGDVVEVAPGDRLTLAIDGPFGGALAGESDNLVLRAAKFLGKAVGRAPNVAIRLTKNLPVGAGLGGGSADAAAMLRALQRLWGIDLTPAESRRIALSLGADVAVCLDGRPAFVSGIGDIIRPLSLSEPLKAVLIHPGKRLLTRAVFEARSGPFSASLGEVGGRGDALVERLGTLRNDLTLAAESACQEVRQLLDIFSKFRIFRWPRMSGSGSCCLAFFDNRAEADHAVEEIAASYSGWWIRGVNLGYGSIENFPTGGIVAHLPQS